LEKRQSIQELQTRLASRLAEKDQAGALASWLAVDVAGRHLLLPLRQAGELFAPRQLVRVPYTKNWFLGMANLRGALYGVVDLALFLGFRAPTGPAWGPHPESQLIGLPDESDTHCALAVDRLLGLKSPHEFVRQHEEDASDANPLVKAIYRDPSDRVWQEIDLIQLSQMTEFLDIHERPTGAQ
jgi:twitching motility protein PilI